jgi:DNA-binding XRE family transcriptional regulator
MSTVRWSDIRDKHVEAIGREDVERGRSRLIAQVRAHRLPEMRKRCGLTQREVAQAMGVTVGRVSQIENGELSGRRLTVTSPLLEASLKSSRILVTNSSRSAERRS